MSARSFRRGLLHFLLLLAIFLLLTVNGLLLWVATGPRDLSHYNHYVEEALSSPTGAYKVHIGETTLLWDGWEHPIDVRVRQVEITGAGGEQMLSLPQLSLGIHIPSLLLGNVAFTSVRVYEPKLVLEQQEDRRFKLNLGISGGGEAMSWEEILLQTESHPTLRHLQRIAIINAYVELRDAQDKPLVIAPGSRIFLRRRDGELISRAELKMLYKDQPSVISSELKLSPEADEVEGKLEMVNFDPEILALILPDDPNLKKLHAPVSGSFEMAAKASQLVTGKLQSAKFDVALGAGKIDVPELFEETLNIRSVAVKGNFKEAPWELNVTGATFQFDRPVIRFEGAVFREEAEFGLRGLVEAQNAEVKELRRYWPVPLAPKTRSWVIGHFLDGMIPHAEATLNLRPGELGSSNIREDSIAASVALKDATIQYFPHHSEVRNVVGVANFTGKAMQANISSADYMTASKAMAGKIAIPDLNADDVWMDMEMKVETPARDVATFINYPELKHLSHLNIQPDGVSGSATGDIKLHFRIFAAEETPETESADVDGQFFRFDITGKITNASVKAFQKKWDISALDSEVSLHNDFLEMKGTLTAADVPLTMDMKSIFTETPTALQYRIKATAPAEKLVPLGFPNRPELKGTVTVDADIQEKGTGETVDATVDATSATLDLSDYGWKKEPGQAATIKARISGKEGGEKSIESFSITSGDNRIQGSGKLQPDGGIAALKLPQVKLGRSDFAVDWTYRDKVDVMKITGHSYDYSKKNDTAPEGGKRNDFFRNIDLTLDLERLISGEDAELKNVKGFIRCTEICAEANITGAPAPGKTVHYVIGSLGGKRTLEISSNDAGALLRSMDVYQTMQGGVLSVKGVFKDGAKGHPLIGRATVGEHHITQAPVLAKILTIASITGIPEALAGKGIYFNKLAADFEYRDMRIMVKNAKSAGASLGITAEGMIDLNDGTMDLSGTVVPANVLNSMFSDIPLIGNLLGGDGGIIATNYSVKGKYENPRVSVNPLSMLTPGFTRNFFDIFDSDPSFEDYDEEGNKIEKEVQTLSPSAKERRQRSKLPE